MPRIVEQALENVDHATGEDVVSIGVFHEARLAWLSVVGDVETTEQVPWVCLRLSVV